MTVKLYVEGGGDHNKDLKTRCRRGFSEFLGKAGLRDRMPRVVACGGRQQAFDRFRSAHESGTEDDLAILLVDSEAPVDGGPWTHVKLRSGDGWDRPSGASDDQIHLMVQAMEAWFHADKEKLEEYYKNGFRPDALSQRKDMQEIPKNELFRCLKQATKNCLKGEYSKGDHSFEILALIRPAKISDASTHARRFLDAMDRIC